MSLPQEHRVIFLVGPEQVELRRQPLPRPTGSELLVRVAAATTCGTDLKVFRRGGHPRMLQVPTPFGHEMAGTVVATGEAQDHWRVGDRVAVANSACCGSCSKCLQGRENLCLELSYLNGAFADFILVPERFAAVSTHRCPDGLSLEEAALSEPLACALHCLDGVQAALQQAPPQTSEVVIFGAGPLGLLLGAVAAREGHRVLSADPNPSRLELARALGCQTLVLQRGGGQASKVRERSDEGRGFRVAIDASGQPEAWQDAIESVEPGGCVALFGGCSPGTELNLDTHLVHYSEITLKGIYHHRPATFRRALKLLAEGQLGAELLLSEERPLDEVELALRRMGRKEAVKVVIRPQA